MERDQPETDCPVYYYGMAIFGIDNHRCSGFKGLVKNNTKMRFSVIFILFHLYHYQAVCVYILFVQFSPINAQYDHLAVDGEGY